MNTTTNTPAAAQHTAPTKTYGHPTTRVPVTRVLATLSARVALILALGFILIASQLSLIYANALIVIIDLATIAIVWLAMRAEGRKLREFFTPWRWVDLGWGALMLVLLVIGFLASNIAANLIVYGGAPPIPETMPEVPLWVGIIALTLAPLTIAIAEEVLYRGYAQSRLAGRLGTALSLILVAVIFGAQHIGFALDSAESIAAKVLTTLFAGLILGALMLWMKRTAPLILGHWGLDLLFLGIPTFVFALA